MKVAIIGAKGKMGAIATNVAIKLGYSVVAVERHHNLSEIIKNESPDFAIEFSGERVKENCRTLLKRGVPTIIGSSGLSEADIEEFRQICEAKVGCIVAPNFSLGMMLCMRAVENMRPYFPHASIIEFHHSKKKDKPSGTAKFLAQRIGVEEKEIASVRSDAFMAKQQVYLGKEGERVVVDHESFSRDSFSGGIEIAYKKILAQKALVYLDSLI